VFLFLLYKDIIIVFRTSLVCVIQDSPYLRFFSSFTTGVSNGSGDDLVPHAVSMALSRLPTRMARAALGHPAS
jgi:hypothetical protein